MTLDIITSPFERDVTQPYAVEGILRFIEPGPDKPFAYAGTPPEGKPQVWGDYRNCPVLIRNARPTAGQWSLDVEGFAFAHHETSVSDFHDEAQVLALGHPEAAELVRQVTGACRVVVFDHTIRRRAEGIGDYDAHQPRLPAARLHVDQTIWSGPERVRQIMGAQAEALLAGRSAIINVWRPIAYAARDCPLVLGDARSIEPADLIATDLIFPHRRGETYSVAYNPGQRWFYVPDVAPDEAILIKCWDSDSKAARFAPHSGFNDSTTPPDALPRQSIEFRTIAFFG